MHYSAAPAAAYVRRTHTSEIAWPGHVSPGDRDLVGTRYGGCWFAAAENACPGGPGILVSAARLQLHQRGHVEFVMDLPWKPFCAIPCDLPATRAGSWRAP